MIWDVKRAAELIELTLIFFEFLLLSWNWRRGFSALSGFCCWSRCCFLFITISFHWLCTDDSYDWNFFLLLSCYDHFFFTEKNDECDGLRNLFIDFKFMQCSGLVFYRDRCFWVFQFFFRIQMHTVNCRFKTKWRQIKRFWHIRWSGGFYHWFLSLFNSSTLFYLRDFNLVSSSMFKQKIEHHQWSINGHS